MTTSPGSRSTVRELLISVAGARVGDVLDAVESADELTGEFDPVPRRLIAHALNIALFADLLDRVPSAAEYLTEQRAAGRRIMLDHGAIRTVAWPNVGSLPAGIEQVTRLLEPLGFRRREMYPLTRIHMTGYSYCHLDMPEQIGQWFVSEFHPDELSVPVQHGVDRVFSSSVDPIGADAASWLRQLESDGSLPFDIAVALLAVFVRCFARQHELPTIDDYHLLLSESAELAWIATEGTSFNHATDRVDDVQAVAAAERSAGRPIKDSVEVSGSGRVQQTAHRATFVVRPMRTAEGTLVEQQVPGSFFEFIERDVVPDEVLPSEGLGERRLDLGFDASNAQGIFAMTRSNGAAR